MVKTEARQKLIKKLRDVTRNDFVRKTEKMLTLILCCIFGRGIDGSIRLVVLYLSNQRYVGMKTVKMLNIAFCVLLAWAGLSAVSANAEEVYKWVDSNGVTHYGDEQRVASQNGASKIEVKAPKVGTVETNYVPKGESIRPVNGTSNSNIRVSIVSPSNGQEIRANDGVITVSSSINPKPSGNYSTKVYIDGSLFGSANNSSSVRVEGVPRGEHQITTKVQVQDGKIFTSNSVKVTVLRVSVGGK